MLYSHDPFQLENKIIIRIDCTWNVQLFSLRSNSHQISIVCELIYFAPFQFSFLNIINTCVSMPREKPINMSKIWENSGNWMISFGSKCDSEYIFLLFCEVSFKEIIWFLFFSLSPPSDFLFARIRDLSLITRRTFLDVVEKKNLFLSWPAIKNDSTTLSICYEELGQSTKNRFQSATKSIERRGLKLTTKRVNGWWTTNEVTQALKLQTTSANSSVSRPP